MKRFFLTLALALAVISAFAEKNISVEFGPQLSSRIGYRLGVNLEVPLSEGLSLVPGLYIEKNTKIREFETSSQAIYDKRKLKIEGTYLYLPIKWYANLKLDRGNLVQLYAGTYLSYCMGGDTKKQYIKDGNVTSSVTYPTLGNKDNDPYVKHRYDYGLLAGGNLYFLRNFFVGLNVELGLRNLYSNDDAVGETTNDGLSFGNMHHSVGISLGYRF